MEESHLKNLLVLAMSDGHMAEIEDHLLTAIAHRLGLDEQDVQRIMDNIDEVDFVLPDKYEDRIEQFSDLLTLMAVDGHIDPEEEKHCRELARKYELMPTEIDRLLEKFH